MKIPGYGLRTPKSCYALIKMNHDGDEKHRCYQFTWHNYTDEDIEYLKSLKSKYICWGHEVCPETGTPHLQGMVLWNSPMRWRNMKEKFRNHHFEVTKSFNALKKYNFKDGDVFEQGEKPQQGRRLDMEEQVERVKEGATNRELWIANPTLMVQYHRSFERCRYDLFEDRTEAPGVYWFWGGTGTGKTRTAFEAHPSRYMKDGTMWWDGYTQQDAIIIDDFDGKWPFRDLLRLLDRYPYSGQVKGGYVKINSKHIYITCEFPPECFWEGTELEQIKRRLTTVRKF